MAALTPELLHARIELLRERCAEVAGPIEAELFSRLGCDRCGVTVDLLDGHPIGWTSNGDLEHGFTDLCPACST